MVESSSEATPPWLHSLSVKLGSNFNRLLEELPHLAWLLQLLPISPKLEPSQMRPSLAPTSLLELQLKLREVGARAGPNGHRVDMSVEGKGKHRQSTSNTCNSICKIYKYICIHSEGSYMQIYIFGEMIKSTFQGIKPCVILRFL